MDEGFAGRLPEAFRPRLIHAAQGAFVTRRRLGDRVLRGKRQIHFHN